MSIEVVNAVWRITVNMKKLFCLMGIISSYAYPSFATNTEMEALLELAMSSRTSQEDVLDRLFPEGHSFHPRSSQHLNLQEFRKLKRLPVCQDRNLDVNYFYS